jgi:hypothetical protein
VAGFREEDLARIGDHHFAADGFQDGLLRLRHLSDCFSHQPAWRSTL